MPLPTGPTVPIKFQKAIASLPATLTPNSFYAVRVGDGFELYVSDMTGTIAYRSNATVGPKGDTGQGFSFLGPWDNTYDNYHSYDVVTYNGELYLCVNSPDARQNPATSYYWTKIVESGPQGPQGEIGPQGPQGEIGPSPATTIYTAQTIDLTNGVYVSGDVTSIQNFNDGQNYALTDGSHAGPAWIVNATFTGVTSFNQVDLNISYTVNSGHTVFIQLYNNNTEGWDNIGSYNGLSGYIQFQLGVISGTSYINSGTVIVRLYHNNTGNPAHQTFIDYIAVVDSIAGGQGPRGLTGATGPQGPTGPASTVPGPKGDTGPAGAGLAPGGSAGYVLIKNSSADYDTSWQATSNLATSNLAAIKTFNILGTAVGPLTGTAIFRPFANLSVSRVELSSSTMVSTIPVILVLYQNDAITGTFYINPGQYTASYTGLSIQITSGSAVRVDLISGSVTNFTMALY